MTSDDNPRQADGRRKRMAVLAHADGDELRRLWQAADISVDARLVRGPETGLATVRGRIGGGGSPFNVGEVTVTRATVRLADGQVGHAYALGRDHDKTRIAATLDALSQDPVWQAHVEEAILAPLRRLSDEAETRKREETAATKVDFFTLVRGED